MNELRGLNGYFEFTKAIAEAELLLEKLNKEENKEESE